MENEDLKKIKKIYGEEFMKMCRRNFPTLLETPGLLFKLITDHVEPTKIFMKILSLNSNPIEIEDSFKSFIYSFVDVEKENPEIIGKTAKELMDEAGYVLFPECKTEEQIQKFKGFYAPNEALCTFRGGRLDYCRVWFAVKKNAVSLNRKDFKNPKREDEYGTSVISIQFTKGTPSTLSIKNRYNHTVNNPDATFLNNLDNIIPGLTKAFERDYGLITQSNSNVFDAGGFITINGKLYCGAYEVNNMIYTGNNVIFDNYQEKRFDKQRYIVFGKYIIDKSNKTIECYNTTKDPNKSQDSFTRSFGKIKSVEEITTKNGHDVIVHTEQGPVTLGIVEGFLTKYVNPFITEVGDNFLDHSFLEYFSAPKLKHAGKSFLRHIENLGTNCEIDLPALEDLKDHSFRSFSLLPQHNQIKINIPNVKSMEEYCFNMGDDIETLSINAPNLEEIYSKCFQDWFSYAGDPIREYTKLKLNMPNVKLIKDDCFRRVATESLELPNVKRIGARSFQNYSGTELDLPSVEYIGSASFCDNKNLKRIKTPNLVVACDGVFERFDGESADFPSLANHEGYLFAMAPNLKNFRADNLTRLGYHCFSNGNDKPCEFDNFIAPKLTLEKARTFADLTLGAVRPDKVFKIKKFDCPAIEDMVKILNNGKDSKTTNMGW